MVSEIVTSLVKVTFDPGGVITKSIKELEVVKGAI